MTIPDLYAAIRPYGPCLQGLDYLTATRQRQEGLSAEELWRTSERGDFMHWLISLLPDNTAWLRIHDDQYHLWDTYMKAGGSNNPAARPVYLRDLADLIREAIPELPDLSPLVKGPTVS
jgi:hypothetical protein